MAGDSHTTGLKPPLKKGKADVSLVDQTSTNVILVYLLQPFFLLILTFYFSFIKKKQKHNKN